MAEATSRKRRYERTVYGSLAYDLTAEEFFPDSTYEEPEIFSRPEVEEEVRVRAVPRVQQALAPTAILGFACAAVMLVFTLMAQIQLTQISDETMGLQTALSELELEQTRLLIDYESAFNLTEIEEYATGVLGMQKPRSDQVFYVDGSAPDKAEVLGKAEEGGSLTDRFSDLLTSLGDFFN